MGEELWAGPAEEPDRYTLWAVIGGGAEGRVYRATQALADGHLDVAVKVMLPDRFGVRGEAAEQVAARWADQAARLRNLRHPGLVGVQEAFLGPPPHAHGVVPEGRIAYFVMAWVEGRDLGTWLAESRSGADRIGVISNVADALDELHAAGQVHADVKPGNILVRTTALPTGSTMESAVLVDFGLMRAITGTRPSEVGYTAGYVAPELRHGAPYSPASDLYALAGVVLYALTGEHPPAGGDVAAEARRRLAAIPVSPATAEAIAAGLHPNPGSRPRGCRAWLNAARDGLSSSTTAVLLPPSGVAGPNGDDSSSGKKAKKERRSVAVALRVAVSLTVTATAAIGGAKYADQAGNDDDKATADTIVEEEPTTTTARSRTTTTTAASTTDPTSPFLGRTAFLDELSAAESGGSSYDGIYRRDDANLNGVVYLHALVGGAACDTATSWVDYDLSRDWSRFTTTIGIEDGAPAASAATYNVYLDNAPVATGDVQLGRPLEVDLDVTDGLRLRLEMINRTCGVAGQRSVSTKVVFADPKLEA